MWVLGTGVLWKGSTIVAIKGLLAVWPHPTVLLRRGNSIPCFIQASSVLFAGERVSRPRRMKSHSVLPRPQMPRQGSDGNSHLS